VLLAPKDLGIPAVSVIALAIPILEVLVMAAILFGM
jgi:hypothetical protein